MLVEDWEHAEITDYEYEDLDERVPFQTKVADISREEETEGPITIYVYDVIDNEIRHD